ALALVEDVVGNLGDDDEDAYELYPVADLQHTLAVLLAIHGADVVAVLDRAGAHASAEHRERLFEVFDRVRRLLDPKYPWREPEDPRLDDGECHALRELLFGVALTRLDGGWGGEVAHQ